MAFSLKEKSKKAWNQRSNYNISLIGVFCTRFLL